MIEHENTQKSYMERFIEKRGPVVKEPYFDVPAGVYACKITEMSAEDGKVRVLYDIDEGEYEGAYASTPARFEWTHAKTLFLDTKFALSRTFGDLAAISDSNEGFSAEEAFIEEDYAAFIGKRVGVVLRLETYTTADGYPGSKLNPLRFIPVDQIDLVPVPEPKSR